jgi:peptide subunit release factor 1 (eRF1)
MSEVVERNMRDAADFAARFFMDSNVRRVLIGGTDDNVAMFRNLLPKSWQSLIVGTFPMSMSASNLEVLDRAMQIGQQAEYNYEEQLVKKVVTSSAKGRGGVMGLEDTLSAVHEGRVQILVLREGYRAPGFRCLGCGYVTTQMLSACQFCGGEFENIPDAVESALHKFMLTGEDVNVLFQDHLIPGFENIGALLRY